MKKSILFLLSIIFSISSIFAQQEVYYGPKVGLNVSQLFLSGEEGNFLKDNSGMKVSTHMGGFLELVFSDFYALQPELLFSVKGARFKSTEDDEFKSAYVYKYISAPILFKYFVKERVAIELGPQVSYLLSAQNMEVNGIFSSNNGSEEATINLKDNMKDIDLGVILGVGYITKNGFYFDLRYEYGVMDLTDPSYEGNLKQNNGVIMLSTGFSFKY